MNVTIQNAVAEKPTSTAPAETAKKTVSALVNSVLDSEGYRKRFNELLGARTPQFVSSIVSLVNGDANLMRAFRDNPITVIQSALKAATYDLPIDPGLGYAYIVPFNVMRDGVKGMEASFVIGYKGMIQLALRTGAYKTINVIDVREGELKSYNRLTEEADIEFIEDDDERDKLPIVGWCGYYKLINGTEKTVYMTRSQIEAHERKNRKGQYMGKGWKDDFEAMAAKTVLRRLIGKWGLMSINYQKADRATLAAAEAISRGKLDDEDELTESATIATEEYSVDPETGEMKKIDEAVGAAD